MKFLSDEYWPEMSDRLAASEAIRAAVAGHTFAVQWVVTSAPGGEDVRYHLAVADGVPSLRPGDAPSAIVTITLPWKDAVAIDTGELHAQHALATRRLRITGNLPLYMEMEALFGAIAEVSGQAARTY